MNYDDWKTMTPPTGDPKEDLFCVFCGDKLHDDLPCSTCRIETVNEINETFPEWKQNTDLALSDILEGIDQNLSQLNPDDYRDEPIIKYFEQLKSELETAYYTLAK